MALAGALTALVANMAWMGAFLTSSAPAMAQSNSVVISQIYGGGGNKGAPLRSNFVELFNSGNQAVNLAGWTIQYAAAAGTNWDRTQLIGSIQPGQYYLIEESTGSTGAPTPNPDAVGGINLNAESGKVALVAGLSNLTGSVPNSPQLIDFVGYGATNASLGSPAPLLDNTTAAIRNGSGCTNTRNNSKDFSEVSPAPRNSKSPFHPCSTVPVPAINITAGGVTNAASFAATNVAPGEILTIFGSGMGPANLQVLQLNAIGTGVTTSLAGTQVLFSGIAGPLIYTRSDQVSVIVPYGVSGSGSVAIQVTYNNQSSNIVSLPLSSSAPGIFTIDSSGKGQGAIQNQDYSVNGPAHPALPGSVIIVYATGAGGTTPQAADGAIIGLPLPLVQESVHVLIDGIEAEVLYAGMAPQQVNGVLQINALVPLSVTHVGSLPLQVSVGGTFSQPGVTVTVMQP
jgi:uncharacterized protein (TIGR03437 family)